MGALAFHLLRAQPPRWIKGFLVLSAVAQIALAIVQIYWWDPTVWGQTRENFAQGNVVLGTIGQQTHFGAYVAMVGTVAPWWIVPVFVGGVLLSGSRLAWLALGAALVVRMWPKETKGRIA
jgi:hypothetical protein